jgi:hypothetical protein
MGNIDGYNVYRPIQKKAQEIPLLHLVRQLISSCYENPPRVPSKRA